MDEEALLNELTMLLASLYTVDGEAGAVLDRAGYTAVKRPSWGSNARNFWQMTLERLHRGATTGGVPALLAEAALDWPGSGPLRRYTQAYRAAFPPEEDEAAPATDTTPPAEDKEPLEETRLVAEPAPGEQEEARETRESPAETTVYPTITVYGGDRYDDFERAVAAHVPEAELLYGAHQQAGFRVVLPEGTDGQSVANRVDRDLRGDGENLEVTYAEHPFRPYTLRRLVAHGPDNRSFELVNVPATSPASDVAYAVLQHYADESVRDRRGRYMRTTVHRVNADGSSTPLNPSEPLHGQVEEGDELRVATEANAGAGWREAILRARGQIRRYADEHPGFRVVDTDDPELPTYYEFEFEANGFGPPENDDEPLTPTLVSQHRVEITLPASYPNNAPLAVWQTDIFHPNVLQEARGRAPKGFVCLGPLLDAYRPNLDLGGLCAMLVAMAGYRVYDALEPSVQDGEGYLNRQAAAWARSEAGRELIEARGGELQREGDTGREPAAIHFEVVEADDWGAWD